MMLAKGIGYGCHAVLVPALWRISELQGQPWRCGQRKAPILAKTYGISHSLELSQAGIQK